MGSPVLDIGLERTRSPRRSIEESVLEKLGPRLDFVAIDVETANSSRWSICSVGVALVHDGQVKLDGSFLINPECEFSHYNIAVNGIAPEDVRESPTMPEAWPLLMSVLDGARLCAHAATFDVGALRSVAARYNLPGPTADVYCSWRIAKRLWPEMKSYGLGVLAPALGFPFDHHDAGQDALACAHVMLTALADQGVTELDGLAATLDYSPGSLTPRSFMARRADTPNRTDDCVGPNPNHPLYNKSLCFTGAMYSMVRREAWDAVAEVGGLAKQNMSADVDYLVIGDADFVAFADGWSTGKLARAMALQAKGVDVEIISERDFLAMLFS